MKKGITRKPEQGMTPDEAQAFASGVASNLQDRLDDSLTHFIPVLRWLAYQASDNDRESLYIAIESEYATSFNGVEGAIAQDMQNSLDALRRRKVVR